MKRKDWKIKKLKEGFYDKKKYFFKKILLRKKKTWRFFRIIRVNFILRKLILRKFRNLFRRGLILNYVFYKNFLKTFNNSKNNYYNYIYFDLRNIKNFFFPSFLVKKKVFNTFNKFKKLQYELKFDYFFYNTVLNKKDLSNKINKDLFGLKLVILDNNIINDNRFKLFLENEDNKDIISQKFNLDIKNFFVNGDNLNYFFHFNLFQNNVVEIYKIIVILYINKIYK